MSTTTRFPAAAFQVARLGQPRFAPNFPPARRAIEEDERVMAYTRESELSAYLQAGEELPTFEVAGPRNALFFDPSQVTAAVVTCGGLCPGLNDVIRSVVLTASFRYGVRKVLGIRYGYAGLGKRPPAEPVVLDQSLVSDLHWQGGTMLASARGTPSTSEMVDTLERLGVDMLFTIGGDGTLRGASALAAEIHKRGRAIAVIGVPKTIDNDINWVAESFGFRTAVEEARRAILAAHVEARGAWNGIGLVKLMGRHAGFIAANATLSNPDVNYCLIPEVPFALEGATGLLATLERRLIERHHAVIVVAEGAGQDLLKQKSEQSFDASGNAKLKDIGLFLKDRIVAHMAERNLETTVKYIDPSYIVRSLPANASDSELCLMLGQNAVHAAMAGRTNMVVSYWHQHFTHVPISLAVQERKQVEENGDTWQAVLASTGQPIAMGAATEPA